MNKKEEKIALEDMYAQGMRELMEAYTRTVFGSRFDQEGIHSYGASRYVPKAYFDELLTLLHPSHLDENLHVVFFPNRRSVLKKMFSQDYCCRQDIESLWKKNPYSCFQSITDSYLYFYEFNLEKTWEETIIISTILTYLYQLRHPTMNAKKRRKKEMKYILRMFSRIQRHFEEKKQITKTS